MYLKKLTADLCPKNSSWKVTKNLIRPIQQIPLTKLEDGRADRYAEHLENTFKPNASQNEDVTEHTLKQGQSHNWIRKYSGSRENLELVFKMK